MFFHGYITNPHDHPVIHHFPVFDFTTIFAGSIPTIIKFANVCAFPISHGSIIIVIPFFPPCFSGLSHYVSLFDVFVVQCSFPPSDLFHPFFLNTQAEADRRARMEPAV